MRSVASVDVGPDAFLRAIRDESGLLTGWGDDTYGFMHLGFQEYLAALAVRSASHADKQVLDALAREFGNSWWREVTLLVLALGEPSLFAPLMERIVELDAFAEHGDLVDACMQDALVRTPAPFLELLAKRPGKSKKLWARQLAAVRVVRSVWPEEAKRLADDMRRHPSPEISGLFGVTAQRTRVARKSGVPLIEIPGGTFAMGSPEGEAGRFATEGPVRRVGIRAFALARTPVTNEQYAHFLDQNADVEKPEYWSNRKFNGAQQPVVGVSWEDAQRYCAWAGLRLPSEAEWEYACRAGTTTRFWSGDDDEDLARVGWYTANSEGRTHNVAEKEPNAFGLFDVHGNVLEWCEDAWHDSYEGAPADGRVWAGFGRRVVRGGGWPWDARSCRSAARGRYWSDHRDLDLGFRPAR